MAAGQGFKTFVTGEVLTAGDVNGYLMQGINVFTNATARDTAITAPAEGQFAFTKDNNSLWYYDGAAWVASGAAGDIEGVTAGVGISGGGTSGTVTVTNSMATAIDAKGDLVPGTGADTFARLAVGANDTVLTADSTTATGLKWATPAGGAANWTLLNTGGTALTGASTVTVSGISGADKIMVLVSGASSNTVGTEIGLRLNGDTGNNYRQFGGRVIVYSPPTAGSFTTYNITSGSNINMGVMSNDAGSSVSGYALFTGCNTSGVKIYNQAGGGTPNGNNDQHHYYTGGFYNSSSAITSISIVSIFAGNLDAGTVFVYTSA
jgi:hypothetical protein